MKKRRISGNMAKLLFVGAQALFLTGILLIIWLNIPSVFLRYILVALLGGMLLIFLGWAIYLRRQVTGFADELCQALDELIAGRKPENYCPYEDSLVSKVEGKLLQYNQIMNETKEQNQSDKRMLQEIVSDISHQVKTPVANVKMFTGILQQHELTQEKRAEFLHTMEVQINKLDFLMQSLIKMSRLETGTFVINMKETEIFDTIAQAVSGVWTKAEQKDIQMDVDCDSTILVKHDPKWTAEALMNILDNAVKYTPSGGSVHVAVRPWQIYTRIDISDTGIGIEEGHYNDIFQRFYRAQEVAAEEGVGLGLYLAQGIVNRQNGYISVKSGMGEGTTFSVYLLSEIQS